MKLGIDEWTVRLMNFMYDGENLRVRVNSCSIERFGVTVGIHQGFILSLLLFTIMLEAISCECCIGCPRETLYADNLGIMSNNLEDLKCRLQVWR